MGAAGSGLSKVVDTSEYYNYEASSDTAESYNDLTGSFGDQSIVDHILSGSDLNLNIDYNTFDTHVFFGSAKERLKNFKTKVSNIELKRNSIFQLEILP